MDCFAALELRLMLIYLGGVCPLVTLDAVLSAAEVVTWVLEGRDVAYL